MDNKKDFENLILAPGFGFVGVVTKQFYNSRRILLFLALFFQHTSAFGKDNILEDASNTVTSKVVPETKSIYEGQK